MRVRPRYDSRSWAGRWGTFLAEAGEIFGLTLKQDPPRKFGFFYSGQRTMTVFMVGGARRKKVRNWYTIQRKVLRGKKGSGASFPPSGQSIYEKIVSKG